LAKKNIKMRSPINSRRKNMSMRDLPLKVQQEMRAYFEKNSTPESRKKEIVEKAKALYKDMLYDPQEPMGVVAAQSLSEPCTQMTMRTYHFAGTAGIQVTLGLPRMMEIFDARKEPRTPMMTVNLKPGLDLEQVKQIAESIKEIKLKDVIDSTLLDMTEMWIKFRLGREKVASLGIDMDKLAKSVRIKNTETSLEGAETIMVKAKKGTVANLRKLKYVVLDMHVKGIKGITQVVVSKEMNEWTISTLGSNLKKVFEIEGVDTTSTMTNNIFEVYDVLGIEAARNAIIFQTKYTMEEQGLGVDTRYIMLLADVMTASGEVRAIGRYGVAGQKASVLVRASFEETKKHVTAAAIRGETDPLLGTIENIILNQVAPVGTGSFDLVGYLPGAKGKKKKEEPEEQEEE
jgi:DNA-directed RNA polymerase subunit A"